MMTNQLKNRNKIGWIAGVLLLLSSCIDPHTAYHQRQEIEGHAWNEQDTLSFQLDSLQPGHRYVLTLEGRLNKTYEFQNLIMCMVIDNQAQTVAIPIYAEEQVLTSWPNEKPFYLPFQTELDYIPTNNTGKIQIAHSMGKRSLKGVCDIGIHLKQ